MRLTLDQLRSFVQVVRRGGVGRAAAALHLSQPAISARLAGLEAALGVRLLHRETGGLRLTQPGERLLRHAARLEAVLADIERDVARPGAVARLVRVGASETVAQSWLPDFIGDLRDRYPAMALELDVDVSGPLRDRLLAGHLDLAFLLGPISHHEARNVPLPPVPLVWCAAPGVARGARDAFPDLPIVTYARATRPFREMEDHARAHLGERVALFPSASLTAALRLIERGLCVGAMPATVVRPWLDEGRIAPFDPGWGPPPLEFTASFLAEAAIPQMADLVAIAEAAAIRNADR